MRGGGDLRRTLRMFGRFTLGHRRAFASAFVLLAVEAATAVAVPDLIKKLTDFLKDGIRPGYFGWTVSADAAIYLRSRPEPGEDLSDGERAVVATALHADPARRFRTAAEFADAVEDLARR